MISVNGEYSSAVVYSNSISENAYEQIRQLCNDPASAGAVIRVMPDCHAGKSCVIGLTMVSPAGVVAPDLVGADIGCGVRTVIFDTDDLPDLYSLDCFIRENIPSGAGIRSTPFDGIGNAARMEEIISRICAVIGKNELYDSFLGSLCTLGGGNHFIELGKVSDNRYMLSVHSGSRSLGSSVCGYFRSAGELHGDTAYVTGELYSSYMECMRLSMEFAAENRSCIAGLIVKHLGNIRIVEETDTVHNYIAEYGGGNIIARKGAVGAEKGKRLSVPLNMRDGIIVGTGRGNPEWNMSAPHGAGRAMSRSEARRSITLEEYEASMKGISSWSVSRATVDEAPAAYKPAEEILSLIGETVDIDFIAKPVYNFKAK